MSTVVETKKSKFTTSSIQIDVKVKVLLYENGDFFYDLNYEYYSNSALDIEGNIVRKNKMTEIMISYLLMDNEELKKQIGFHAPSDYKIRIIKSLDMFWD